MLDILFEFRYIIWMTGGVMTYWLLSQLSTWQRIARGGQWNAERDYAMWRLHRALLALALLLPLLVATTASAIYY
jgi:hypothetical protein